MNPVQEAKSPGDGCLEGVRGGALGLPAGRRADM